MNGEREVKTGKISVSKSSFLKARTWISRCCTLYDKTDSSPAKILITEDYNLGAEFKTLILENVCAIQKKVSKSKNYKVDIHWRKEKFSFAVDSEQEANSWIDHLNDVADFEHKAGKKNIVESQSSVNESDTEIFVNNVEYQSLDMWTYDVEMNTTEASSRCQLSGPYRLQLTKQGFFLLTLKERRVLYQWPYHFIRRYGKSLNTFTIQAGRKCESGEGSFCFGTKPGESLEIFQKVNQFTLQLKASQNELATDNSPAPQGVVKSNRTSENRLPLAGEVLHATSTSGIDNLWTKRIPSYQAELQQKLSPHTDNYSNVHLSKLQSSEVPQTKIPPMFKTHIHGEFEAKSGKMPNLSTYNDLDRDYFSVEVNNNHGSRNEQSQSREEDYDRLDFNIIETPFEERQKNFKPYLYDSVVIKKEENLYEEATPIPDRDSACGRKLLPVPVVFTQKPFMAPATVDDGYR